MRRQQGMQLDERYVPYLQMAGLYHLARLNDRWFRLDEAIVSAFVERWRPETHTFHIPFRECTITLQDVAYQLELPMDGHYEFLGVIPPPSQVQKYAVNYSWFQETFGECPNGADEETVRRFARAYIMMLLAGPLQLLQSWIFWRFPRFRPAGYDTFSWPLASRWSGYNPSGSEKGPRVQMWRLRIDMLQDREVSQLLPKFI
ncbi:hypothetical protein Ahy_B06g084471 [Arachis hypogaea]|uniref:Aminotransferase-like plant mobile domain-containing protein n=1 Tax=Arachis hypogaea TaxID=3818 RepID=A0A444YS03_ARAHY|nr:hypothetical protein Ahy_B06g084471 [Arachis hypogaea]